MKNLTDKLQQWLDTPSAERDWNEGAILLLQLTNNTIMYRNLSINPKGKAEFIEGKLRAFLKARREVEAHDEVNIMQEQVDAIVASRTEFKEHNEAKDFKAGKRADHDSLPEDIQALMSRTLISLIVCVNSICAYACCRTLPSRCRLQNASRYSTSL